MTGRVVLHLPPAWLDPGGEGPLPFYRRLADGLAARGVTVARVPLDRNRLPEAVKADPACHIVNHGRFRHPRVLNAGIAYIYPFWNLDPHGIRAFSSIGKARFDPAQIDPAEARPFFRRLRQRLVAARRSRYPQPAAQDADLPGAAAVAVFLQSERHRDVSETCYLDRWQMLGTVLSETDAPVVVKPHPRDIDPETVEGLRDLARRYPHLRVSRGNIHDILARSERVVTINSAVGIEAYLHRKPVILCGRADFHHIAETAITPADLARRLARPARRRVYDKYVYWYFGIQCLDATASDLAGQVLARFGRVAGSV